MKKMKIIGAITAYAGNTESWLRGHPVRIVAIIKNALKPGVADGNPEYQYVADDDTLAAVGGVTAYDRVEVQPWNVRHNRYSFVTCDPPATDLDCFSELADQLDRNSSRRDGNSGVGSSSR